MNKLFTTKTVVQAPFIQVDIAGNIFGCYKNSLKETSGRFNAPNYVNSIDIIKINGAINQYTITLDYVIYPGRDPNYIDKVLSKISSDRTIYISYGDCNQQTDSFKNEEAIVTKVTQRCDFKTPKITYTIQAVSAAVYTKGVIKSWPSRTEKGSVLVRELLNNTSNKLKDVFTGMQNSQLVAMNQLIPDDDTVVEVPAQTGVSAFDRLRYIVQCMQPNDGKGGFYTLSIFDSTDAPFYGSYFKITKITKDPTDNIKNGAYELDIGYPGDPMISNFQISTDDQWTILYDYAGDVTQSTYVYKIDNSGELVSKKSPMISRSQTYYETLAADENYWAKVTNFPIKATITFRGLVKPVNLVEYVKLNIIFFGQRSIYSGYYIITEQHDSINQQGFQSTLSLLRVKADE